MMLTPKQVEQIKDDCIDDPWWGVFQDRESLKREAVTMITQLTETDAALRAEVAELREVIASVNTDGLSEAVMSAIIERNALTTRLAQVEGERDGLLAVKWVQETDTHSRLVIAQQQLAASEARELVQNEQMARVVEQARSQERNYWKQQLAALTQERDKLSEDMEVGLQISGSFFSALRPILTYVDVQNPGRHITELIAKLAAAEGRVRELEAVSSISTAVSVRDAQINTLTTRLSQVEEALKWPLANTADAQAGWTHDYKFLQRLQEQCGDENPSLEMVEAILIALTPPPREARDEKYT